MSTENALFHKNAYVGWTHTNGNYYPPDFDPKAMKVDRKVKEKNKKNKTFMSMNMRMMMPFSMNCNTCGDFMYIGTKFNSRMEKVDEPTYLDIAVYRFYGYCKHCRAEFTFKTNPKDGNYVMESGGTRQYEAHADANEATRQLIDADEQAKDDAMAALELKRVDMEREMQAHDDLERIMSMNKRGNRSHDAVSKALDALFSEGKIGADTSAAIVDAGLEFIDPRAQEEEDDEMEDEINAFKDMQKRAAEGESMATASEKPPEPPKPKTERKNLVQSLLSESSSKKRKASPPKKRVGMKIPGLKVVEKKPKVEEEKKEEPAALGGLMGAYGSSSEDE